LLEKIQRLSLKCLEHTILSTTYSVFPEYISIPTHSIVAYNIETRVVYIVSILTSTSRGPSAIAELFVLLVTASVVRVMFFSGKKELIDLIRTYLPFKATSTSTCPLTAAGHFRLTSCDGWPRNYHVMYADLRYFFLDSRYM